MGWGGTKSPSDKISSGVSLPRPSLGPEISHGTGGRDGEAGGKGAHNLGSWEGCLGEAGWRLTWDGLLPCSDLYRGASALEASDDDDGLLPCSDLTWEGEKSESLDSSETELPNSDSMDDPLLGWENNALPLSFRDSSNALPSPGFNLGPELGWKWNPPALDDGVAFEAWGVGLLPCSDKTTGDANGLLPCSEMCPGVGTGTVWGGREALDEGRCMPGVDGTGGPGDRDNIGDEDASPSAGGRNSPTVDG